MHMDAGIRMKADQVGTGLGERACQRIDRPNHQMHVDRHRHAGLRTGMGFERGADHGAKRQVGNIVVVHDVEVNPVRAGGDDSADLGTQLGKVGGQDGGGDTVRHGCGLVARK